MLVFKEIIACLDLSEIDATIIKNTQILCETTGNTEVRFLNIIKDFNIPDTIQGQFPELLDNAIKDRKKSIQSTIDKYLTKKISYEIIVKMGSATKTILKEISIHNSDLVILGKKPRSNSVLVGRIARRTPCNLLVLPKETTLNFNKILVPVDFSDYSQLALNFVNKLTISPKAEVYLNHVYNVPTSYRYSGMTYEEFAEMLKENADEKLNKMLSIANFPTQRVTTIYTLGKSNKEVFHVYIESKKKEIDLIVMGVKGMTSASVLLIGSTVERMIRINDQIPLLVITKKGERVRLFDAIKNL